MFLKDILQTRGTLVFLDAYCIIQRILTAKLIETILIIKSSIKHYKIDKY